MGEFDLHQEKFLASAKCSQHTGHVVYKFNQKPDAYLPGLTSCYHISSP